MNLLEGADQNTDVNALRAELEAKWADKPEAEVRKAKVEADLHIKALERENAEVRQMYLSQRDELLAKAKFEDLLDQMKKTSNPDLPVAPPPANEDQRLRYDPAEIERIVLNKIQETENLRKETTNFNQVQTKLKERYGDNVASVLREQQHTLGLSDDEINGLAKRSPEAFFRIMGLNQQNQSNFQSPPRSANRNDNFAPRGEPKRDYQYYQDLKKSNPRMYLDPKISTQMMKDAEALGDAFGLPSG